MSKTQHDVFPYNLKEIKKQAKHTIRKGALTDDYPLDVNQACHLLNAALATEIVCVLRYRHHQIIAKGTNSIEIAAEFKEHAENEEKHMLMIAERINQLGGDPDFNPHSVIENTATEYGSSQNLVGMLEEDLVAERIVIMLYRKLVKWFASDSTTRRMLEHILRDEEEHANDLADLLAGHGR